MKNLDNFNSLKPNAPSLSVLQSLPLQSIHQSLNSKSISHLLAHNKPIEAPGKLEYLKTKDCESSRLNESHISCTSSISQRTLRADMKFSQEEKTEYTKIYDHLRIGNENFDKINVVVAARFLKRSGLPREVLKNIWIIAVKNGDKEDIRKSELFACLKMVALAQKNLAYGEEALVVKLTADQLPTFKPVSDRPTKSATINSKIGEGRDLKLRDHKTQITPQTFVPKRETYEPLRSSILEAIKTQPKPTDKLIHEFRTVNSKPKAPSQERARFLPDNFKDEANLFNMLSMGTGELTGSAAKQLFIASKLGNQKLSKIWNLVDIERKGTLTEKQFIVAMFLIYECKKNEDMELRLSEDIVMFLARETKTSRQSFSSISEASDRDLSQESETIRNLLSIKLSEAQREIDNLRSINSEILNERRKDDMLLIQMLNAFQEVTKGLHHERSLLKNELSALDERKKFLKSFVDQAKCVMGDVCKQNKSEREVFVKEVRRGFDEINLQLRKIMDVNPNEKSTVQNKAEQDPFENFEAMFSDKSWQKITEK